MKAMLLLKQAKIRAAAVLKLHGRYISTHEQSCNSSARAFFRHLLCFCLTRSLPSI